MKSLLAAAVLMLAGHAARAASVDVSVTGVRNDHGVIVVAVCERASFLQPHCPWQAKAMAMAGTVHVHVPNVPPGTYAAQAFHDEDGNGRLERSFLGLPKEGMGFSNGAPMHFGPPRFEAACFSMGKADAAVTIPLRYY
jgi:uncharacterized protein (DUF2141 family)